MNKKNSMFFRPARIEDIESIVSLYNNCKKEMANKGIDQWDEIYPNKGDFYDDIVGYSMYLGYVGNDLISAYVINNMFDEAYFGQGIDWEVKFNEAYCIHRLCVDPKWQSRGIGAETLKDAETRIKGMGFTGIKLDAFSLNGNALNMYWKSGYVKKGTAQWRKGEFYLLEKKI